MINEEMAAMPNGPRKAEQYMVLALLNQKESLHTTWCIEQALKALDVDLDRLRLTLNDIGHDWTNGVAP